VIRRLPILATALAAVGTLALASCAGPDTDDAARVNGVGIPQRVLDVILAAEAPDPAAPDTTAAPVANGEAARGYLSTLIKSEAARQVAKRYGIDLTAGRATAIEDITSRFTGERLKKWNALSDNEKAIIADYAVAMSAMQNRAGDAPADLEQRYANPASTGFYCIRFLFVDTEDAANDAYDALVKGADFAEFANKLNNQSNGGALTTQDGGACLPIDQFDAQTVDPDVAAALHDGKPGVVMAPIKAMTDQGEAYLILLHRPWAEISEDLKTAVSSSPSYADYLALLATGKVSVASRYGVWNPALGAVEQHD